MRKIYLLSTVAGGILLFQIQEVNAKLSKEMETLPPSLRQVASIIDRASSMHIHDSRIQLCREGGLYLSKLNRGNHCQGQEAAQIALLSCGAVPSFLKSPHQIAFPKFSKSICDRNIDKARIDRKNVLRTSILNVQDGTSNIWKIVCTGDPQFKQKLPGKLKELVEVCPIIGRPMQSPQPAVEQGKISRQYIENTIIKFMNDNKENFRFKSYSKPKQIKLEFVVIDNNGDHYFFHLLTGAFLRAEPGPISMMVKKRVIQALEAQKKMGKFDSYSEMSADGDQILVKTNRNEYYHFDKKTGHLLNVVQASVPAFASTNNGVDDIIVKYMNDNKSWLRFKNYSKPQMEGNEIVVVDNYGDRYLFNKTTGDFLGAEHGGIDFLDLKQENSSRNCT